MPFHLEVTDKDAMDLIEFYTEKQKSIKLQMSELTASLKDISSKIYDLKGILDARQTFSSPEDKTAYSLKWHWVKKIQFAIHKEGRPLTTKEIVDILSNYQPEYISERRKAIASVSAILSTKSGTHAQHKEFVKIPADWGEYTYDVWREDEKNDDSDDISNSGGLSLSDLPF